MIAKAAYLPYHHSILSLELDQVRLSSSHSASGGGYPVIVDLYDDSTIKGLEIFSKVSSWQVNFELQAPTHSQTGNLVLSENEHDYSPPTFWTNPDYSLLWIDFSSHSDVGSLSRAVKNVKHIKIADNLILELDERHLIIGWWLLNLPPDISSWRPVQAAQFIEFSDQAIFSLKNMEMAARAREDAFKFALLHKFDSHQLSQIITDHESPLCGCKEHGVASPWEKATNNGTTPHKHCSCYLTGLKEALYIFAAQQSSINKTIPIVREALFCAKGQKEAAIFALQSQGQAYRLQIAIQETEQEIQQATNHYASLYRKSYLSGLKKALRMISYSPAFQWSQPTNLSVVTVTTHAGAPTGHDKRVNGRVGDTSAPSPYRPIVAANLPVAQQRRQR
jgi:hypothetical protein